MSSPEPQPIEKLKLSYGLKLKIERQARTEDDSKQKDKYLFVCQNSSKPIVAGNLSSCLGLSCSF
jgi:hypothetical protein